MTFGLRCGTGDTNRKIVARRGPQVLFLTWRCLGRHDAGELHH
jgi:hypothetical protein